ncbi:uncharacterized protein LOC131935500 [Physella acuta]|uniref:uncharacterized protein LOC131935500 n=1 Tax=Physella acuta TaxID=109671 RepID=UPI0027DAC145|nr:uncharacterized protein LOC131935500 [Physella acuta]
MSLLALKTKNLSWQDHTLNIEVMLAPQGSTLLLNKHKSLDTKLQREKAGYERQMDAFVNNYLAEKRLIERQRAKLMHRRRELTGEKSEIPEDDFNKIKIVDEAANSVVLDDECSLCKNDSAGKSDSVFFLPPHPPKLPLKHVPLFDAPVPVLKPGLEKMKPASPFKSHSASAARSAPVNPQPPKTDAGTGVFITSVLDRSSSASSHTLRRRFQAKNNLNSTKSAHKNRNVSFSDARTPAETETQDSPIFVQIKEKTIEDKVREFLHSLEDSGPQAGASGRTVVDLDLLIKRKSAKTQPLVAAKYRTLTLDRTQLVKAFDKYVERKSYDDLLKAMKMATKMKAHIRQARSTSLVPTMAVFKSTKTFMQILKRKQRIDKDASKV